MPASLEYVPGDAGVSSVHVRVIAAILMPRAVEGLVRVQASGVLDARALRQLADIVQQRSEGEACR